MSTVQRAMTEALNVRLPPDYLSFLELYGPDLAEDPIHDEGLLKGLGNANFVVGTTLTYRSMVPELPHHFILIGYAGTRLIKKINERVDVYFMLDTRDASVHTIDSLGKRAEVEDKFKHWMASSLAKIRLKQKYGSHLLVIVFEDVDRADRFRSELKRLESRRLIHLKDTVVAVRDRSGDLRLRHLPGWSRKGLAAGGLVGLVVGSLLANPLLGATLGGLAGTFSQFKIDPGFDRDFVKEVAKALHPETSALFLLLRKSRPSEVLKAFRGFGGEVLLSSIGEDEERQLQAVLDASNHAPN